MSLFRGMTRNIVILGAVSFLTDVSSEMLFLHIVKLFYGLTEGGPSARCWSILRLPPSAGRRLVGTIGHG